MDNTVVRTALWIGTMTAVSAYSTTLAHGQTAAPVQESDVPERPAGLNGPDNINFGPDGYLYVGEKYAGRIVRISANGTHTVFATGFDNNEGLVFDPQSGDLYVGEIEKATVWRIRH